MSGGPLLCIRARSGRILSEFRDHLKTVEIVRNTFSDVAKSGSRFGLSSNVCPPLTNQKRTFHCGVTKSSQILSSTASPTIFGIRCKCQTIRRRLFSAEFSNGFNPIVNFHRQSVRLFCSPHQAYKSRPVESNSQAESETIEASRNRKSSLIEDKNGFELNSEFLRRFDRIKYLLHEPSQVESVVEESGTSRAALHDSDPSCGCGKSKHTVQESFSKDSSLQSESERNDSRSSGIDRHGGSSSSSHSNQFSVDSHSEFKVFSASRQSEKIDSSKSHDKVFDNSSNIKGNKNTDSSALETSQRIDSFSDAKLTSTSLSGYSSDAGNSASFGKDSSSSDFPHNHVKASGEIQKESIVSAESEEKQMESGEIKSSVDEPTEKMGLFKRFHHTYKQYGKVLVVVHCATSTMWTAVFYYVAMSGVDVEPVLRWLGAGDTIVSFYTMPGVGNAAVAYLFYKLATPARYPVTIAGTHLAVKYLRKFGYMPPVAQENTLRSLVSESKSQMKNKYHRYHDHIDDMRSEYKDKLGEIRSEYKDRFGEIRSEYKDKFGEIRSEYKDRFGEIRSEYKDRLGEIRSEYKDKLGEMSSEYKEQVKNKYHRYHDKIDDIRSDYRESRRNLRDWSKTTEK